MRIESAQRVRWYRACERRSNGPSRAHVAVFVFALGMGCAWSVASLAVETGERIAARVVRVIDGDTLEVSLGEKSRKIRLAEIDAPEKAQPWGREAGAALRRLVAVGKVELYVVDVDRYQRLVCTVFADGVDVNRELVRRGHAWAYTEYAKDLAILGLEKDARAARVGLWSLPEVERESPWEWRRRRRGGGATQPPDPRCKKRSCAEMSSCDEARFHLAQCGLRRLDGDGDGVPCEALCGSKP